MLGTTISPPSTYLRIVGCLLLAACELAAAKALFPLPNLWTFWPAVAAVHFAGKAAILAIAAFLLIAWPRRAELLAELRAPSHGSFAAGAAITNVTSFGLLLATRSQLSQAGDEANAFSLLAYSVLLLTTEVSLLALLVPQRFWTTIARSWRWEIATAATVAIIGMTVSEVLTQTSYHFFPEHLWDRLASATLLLSYWLLALFQNNAFMDSGTRVLGLKDFSVEIYVSCSGYEGMALVAAFLVGYLAVFRRSLRFPQVLILFPVAMTVIWLFNALRIALLVFIGANFSPKIALGGFHSQFGWISFLLVAITIMTVVQEMPFFSTVASVRGHAPAHPPSKLGETEATFFLAPFVAMMAAQIAIRAFAPHDQALYPLKVAAIAAAVYLYRRAYLRFADGPSLLAIGLGVAAGVLWIATDPGSGSHTALGGWLAQLTPLTFAGWLCLRGIGTVVMVPIAEELAFRGYLYRLLISSRFEDVDLRAFSMRALIISSVLFGFMHDRWLAAAAAGVLYALLMCRKGRLSDAIAAHAATNAVIFAWAVAAGDWSLL
jgi:exosortase E/protease (VPEID-CTERM system)